MDPCFPGAPSVLNRFLSSFKVRNSKPLASRFAAIKPGLCSVVGRPGRQFVFATDSFIRVSLDE